MKSPVFTGSCTALISPFEPSGVCHKRMGELIDFQINRGTSALLVCGTTGESPTLSTGEKRALVELCAERISGRVPLIVGIGGNNSSACLESALHAQQSGAAAVLMCTPYYNKATQAGLIRHFTHVADRITIPVILYNVPSRTGIGITAESYRELARHPNINGVKEASGDFTLVSRTRAYCGDELNIWSGNDDNCVPMMALGAKGVISVASNLVPERMAELTALCAAGDYRAAAALHLQLAELFELLFCEVNPIPVKAAMRLLELDSGILRLPLTDMSPANEKRLEAALRRLRLL